MIRTKIRINCDIGERGAGHPVDRLLMGHIHIANLACGGHAGDRESVAAFRALAAENGVEVSAHLSYPDRRNFGRVSLDISPPKLLASLETQCRLLPDVSLIKLHGALYNDSGRDGDLARLLAAWMQDRLVQRVITAEGSELAGACSAQGIQVLPEAFAERRYCYFPESGRLELVSRKKEYASIHDCEEAIRQSKNIVKRGRVRAVVEEKDGSLADRWIPIKAETICIHSDSPISLELARRLKRMTGPTDRSGSQE